MGASNPRLRVLSTGHKEDLRLAQAAAQGDKAAAARLARRLLGRVRTTVRYLVGDSPDAQDLVQDVLVEILTWIGTFQGRSSLETWADRITVRLVMRHIARKRKGEAREAGGPEALAARTPGPDERTRRHLVQQRMAELLQQLSPERRLAVVLHSVYGYTAPEIAELTDTKVNTVRDRIKHGRRILRELAAKDPLLARW